MLEKVAGFDWLPIAQETKRLRESFSSSHERGKKKNKSKGIERQTFGIHTPMLYQWAIEKLMVRWAVTSFIRHTRSTICLALPNRKCHVRKQIWRGLKTFSLSYTRERKTRKHRSLFYYRAQKLPFPYSIKTKKKLFWFVSLLRKDIHVANVSIYSLTM